VRRALLVLCLGCSQPAAEERPPPPCPELVVATFNIRYDTEKDGVHQWSNRSRQVGEQARALGADLLGFQEVTPGQLDALESMLPGYRREGEARDGPKSGEASPLFYRQARFERQGGGTFWLSPTPDRPRSAEEEKPWGTWLNRIATWLMVRDRQSGATLLVVNTHFDHASELARQHSARILVDFVAGHPADHTVVMGDLNARPGSAAHRTLAAALVDLAPPDPARTTMTKWTELDAPGNHIDHIFASRGLRPVDYQVIDRRFSYQGAERYPSDHLPVRARLCPSVPG
jgi:endonuclease/exonuclease/phosphatase family metal-dependent hydrolase